MSDSPSALQELADVPKEFFKDGTQFINRCTKRTWLPTPQNIQRGASELLECQGSALRVQPGCIQAAGHLLEGDHGRLAVRCRRPATDDSDSFTAMPWPARRAPATYHHLPTPYPVRQLATILQKPRY